MSKSQPLRISTVIGNTVAYNATICDNQQGDIAYAAGAVVVIYSIKEERQRQFLHGHSTKPITCLRFSPSGRYLAAGESGKDPKVYVWEVETGALAAQLASFHRLGVLGLAFSQADGGKHLMTVGFQNDGQLAVWDWRQKSSAPVAAGRCSSKLMAVACLREGSVFVTAGVRSIKYWTVPATAGDKPGVAALESRSASLKKAAGFTFVDLATAAHSPSEFQLFALSSNGALCALNAERSLVKQVPLKVTAGYALAVSPSVIACGCSDGILRMFSPMTLEYIATCPRPHGLMTLVEAGKAPEARSKTGDYPDIVGVRLIETAARRVMCSVGSDRSMYTWALDDVKYPLKQRSFFPHSSAICDIKAHAAGFTTAGSDGSLRMWSADELPGSASAITACKIVRPSLSLPNDQKQQKQQQQQSSSSSSSSSSSNPSFSNSPTSPSQDEENGNATSISVTQFLKCPSGEWISQSEAPLASAERCGAESLSSLAINGDATEIAVGDYKGNVFFFQLPAMQCKGIVTAHDGAVKSLDYSKDQRGAQLFASGARDRRIVIFRLRQACEDAAVPPIRVLSTLEDNSAAISNVLFLDGKLVSASTDHSLVVRSINPNSGEVSRDNSQTLSGTVGDIICHPAFPSKAVFPQRKERRVSVLDTASGYRVDRTSAEPLSGCEPGSTAEPVKLQFDPHTGKYLAIGSSDRIVRLHQVDERLSLQTSYEVHAIGHAEPVSGMAFAADCASLLTVAADGCIIRWVLPSSIARQLQSSLPCATAKREEAGLPSWALSAMSSQIRSQGALPSIFEDSQLACAADASFDSEGEDQAWDARRFFAAESRRFTIDPHDPAPINDGRAFVDDFDAPDAFPAQNSRQAEELLSNPSFGSSTPSPAKALEPAVTTSKQPSPAAPLEEAEVLNKRSQKLADEVQRARQRLKELGIIPATPVAAKNTVPDSPDSPDSPDQTAAEGDAVESMAHETSDLEEEYSDTDECFDAIVQDSDDDDDNGDDKNDAVGDAVNNNIDNDNNTQEADEFEPDRVMPVTPVSIFSPEPSTGPRAYASSPSFEVLSKNQEAPGRFSPLPAPDSADPPEALGMPSTPLRCIPVTPGGGTMRKTPGTRRKTTTKKRRAQNALTRARDAMAELFQSFDLLRSAEDADPAELEGFHEFFLSCQQDVRQRIHPSSSSPCAKALAAFPASKEDGLLGNEAPAPSRITDYSKMLIDLAHILKSGSLTTL